MPSASSSPAVAGRPLAQSTTSGPVTHAEPFHRSTTVLVLAPAATGRMRTAHPPDNVIADSSSRNIAHTTLYCRASRDHASAPSNFSRSFAAGRMVPKPARAPLSWSSVRKPFIARKATTTL